MLMRRNPEHGCKRLSKIECQRESYGCGHPSNLSVNDMKRGKDIPQGGHPLRS